MNWKRFVKDYLTFSKKDRIGVLSLIFLGAIIYLLPNLFSKSVATTFIKEDTAFKQAIDSLQHRNKRNPDQNKEYNPNNYAFEPSKTNAFSENAELFTFDPNTLPAEGWKRLGLNDKAIRTIANYRSKGGKFYKPEDLQKIWGLPAGFYTHVRDYISIAQDKKENNPINNLPVYAKEKTEKLKAIDVNKADTSMLIALPGIGSKLSFRIINFRDKLGGFYSVNQIGETYGLPDSTFQKIKSFLVANANDIRKINVNTATKDELKTHPYIKWNLANAIVEYRNQHGAFKNLEELKNIVLLTPDAFEKIAPYLRVD